MTLQDSTHLMTIGCYEKKHLQQISVQIQSQVPTTPFFPHQNCQNGQRRLPLEDPMDGFRLAVAEVLVSEEALQRLGQAEAATKKLSREIYV